MTSASFELIGNCNAKCIHCYANGPKQLETLSQEKLKIVLNNLYTGGIEEISFTGGEPTLYKNFVFAVEYANSLGMNVTVISNGIKLSDKQIDLFNQKVAFPSLSYHAGSESKFIEFYNVSGAMYQSFVKNLGKLNHYSLSSCIIENNKEDLENMLNLVDKNKNNILEWVIYNLQNCGRGNNVSSLISSERKLVQNYLTHQTIVKKINFVDKLDENDHDNCSLIYGQNTFFVSPNGRIKPCYGLLDFVSEKSLVDAPLDEILQDKVITSWINPYFNADSRCKAYLLQQGHSLDYVVKSGGKDAFLNSEIVLPNLKQRIFNDKCRLYNPNTKISYFIHVDQIDLLKFNGQKVKDYVKNLEYQGFDMNEESIMNLFSFLKDMEKASMMHLKIGGKKNGKTRK
ncbi:MAG: radical SAM protein [Nanoarchaeota archaeon]